MIPFDSSLRNRLRGTFFGTIWAIYVALPLIATLTAPLPMQTKAALAGGGIGFVILYASYWFHWVRTRYALLGYAVLAALAVALTLGGAEYSWGTLFIYVTAAGVIGQEMRRAIAMAIVTGAIALGTSLLARQALEGMAFTLLMTFVTAIAMLGMNGMFRANRQLQMARDEIARLAVSEERLRFARDLHDLLGHSLSVIVLKAELAARMAERAPERTASEVSDIERVARDALREVREAVAGYRQPSLSHEIDSARGTLEAAGITVRTDLSAGPLPTSLETALAWTVREGVTNVIRHSGAHEVRIGLARADSRIVLTIADDGTGGPAEPGNGLRGLGERLSARDGVLEFGPRQGGGFQLRATVPLQVTPDRECAPA